MQLPDKDNEFDDLIKNAGENYQATGGGPDWEHMQGLLDKHMPVRKSHGRRAFFLLIGALLLLGGGYLYFSRINDMMATRVKDDRSFVAPRNHAKPSGGINPAIDDSTKRASPLQQPPFIQNIETISSKKELVANRRPVKKHTIAGNSKINIQAGEVAENSLPVNSTKETNTNEKENDITATNDPKASISPQHDSTGNGANKNTAEEKSAPGVKVADNKNGVDKKAAADKKNKTTQGKHPFEFSLLYAPELTTIGFSHIDKPGSNYGLLVGYHISKNMIIETGIIKSKKNYIANGNDFVLDYVMPSNHKLNKVAGYCMMYEIPLNLKSTISGRKKFNFFYTAGISSYIMTSEFYTYNISTSYGNYDKSVKYNMQRNYWLSLATATLGVEKEITPALYVAAAPFIKIPFKGMGEGKLKMTGAGINFLLTYKPAFAKK